MLVLWAVFAGLRINSAYDNAVEARDLLTEFRSETRGSLSRLDLLTAPPDLTKAQEARRSFSRASSELRSPLLAPLKVLPVIGRQIGVTRTLSDSGAALIASVTSAYDEMTGILDGLQQAPASERIGLRVTAVQDLSDSLKALEDTLNALDTGASEGLIDPLWRARTAFIKNRQSLVDATGEAIRVLDGIHSFLDGPNTYVVLVANNSEMRVGSGMFLQISSMTVRDGRFDVDSFGATGDMTLTEPATTFDPELSRVWDGFYPTSEWRNINVTARFDVSGRVATEMWRAMGNNQPQGAVAVDIGALQRLLEVVGPVDVVGPNEHSVSLDSDHVVRYLMLEQYLQRSDDGTLIDRADRRSNLGDVARAAFESLNGEDVSLEDLIKAFTDMGHGRHLLMWSSVPTQQSAWEALGVSGELDETDLMLSLMNRGANKLDQFIDIAAELREQRSGDSRSITVSTSITNSTPDGLPPYVAGSEAASGVPPGDYTGYLVVNLPLGAHSTTVDGADLVATAEDGPTKLAVIKVVIPKGTTLQVDIDFGLHSSWSTIQILPAARIPPVEWTYRGKSWHDTSSYEIELSRS